MMGYWFHSDPELTLTDPGLFALYVTRSLGRFVSDPPNAFQYSDPCQTGQNASLDLFGTGSHPDVPTSSFEYA
jgi:hypothetical protein